MGRAALCSSPAQPALRVLLFTSYKSYYSPTSLFFHPFQQKESRREGCIPPHPQRGKGFSLRSILLLGSSGFLKSSIIYRSPAPPTSLDQKRIGFVITGQQKPQELHRGTKDHFKLLVLGGQELGGRN